MCKYIGDIDMGQRQVWKNENHCIEDNQSRTEELFSDDKFQSVFYSLHQGETITITPEKDPISVMMFLLDGKVLLHSKNYEEVLETNQSVLLTDIENTYVLEGLKFARLLGITSSQLQNADNSKAYLDILKKVEEKDIDTWGHGRRVGKIAMRIAQEYDSSYDLISLGKAATLHDIGKINTPSEILTKPGKLTTEEFRIIQKHPIDSYEMLKDEYGDQVAIPALQHHERLDGSGYPYRLKGDEIGIDARIVAISDVFDAMCSHRVYHEERSDYEVLAYLEEHSNEFDQRFVKILRKLVENGTIKKVRSILQESF